MGTGDSLPEGGAPGMAHISNDRCQALSNCAQHNRFCGYPLARSRPLLAQRLGVSAPLAEITIIGSVEQLANQVWWLSANPVFSSAAQPIRLYKTFRVVKGDVVPHHEVTRPRQFMRDRFECDKQLDTRGLHLAALR